MADSSIGHGRTAHWSFWFCLHLSSQSIVLAEELLHLDHHFFLLLTLELHSFMDPQHQVFFFFIIPSSTLSFPHFLLEEGWSVEDGVHWGVVHWCTDFGIKPWCLLLNSMQIIKLGWREQRWCANGVLFRDFTFFGDPTNTTSLHTSFSIFTLLVLDGFRSQHLRGPHVSFFFFLWLSWTRSFSLWPRGR